MPSRAARTGSFVLTFALSLTVAGFSQPAHAVTTEADYPPVPASWTESGQAEADREQAHAPVAVPLQQLPDIPSSVAMANAPISLGNDQYQCTYQSPNWWSYAWEGAPASWSKNDNGRFDHYGAQDLRSTGYIGGPESATYSAEIGQSLVFNGDGWVRAKVEFPWSYKGDVALDSQFSAVPVGGGFSRGTIDMRFLVDLKRDDSSSALEVDSFSLTANRGVPTEFTDITNSGFATRTVSVTGFGEVLTSAFRTNVDLETETQSLTNARSSFYFTGGDGRGWKLGASQRWIITMKPGFVLTDCG